MSYEKAKQEIVLLEEAIVELDAKVKRAGRGLNEAEQDLRNEIVAKIKEMKMEIPERPLTVQGFGGGSGNSPASGSFAVRVGDKILPVLAREDRLTNHFPIPSGGEEWLARKVRAGMGLTDPRDIRVIVTSGPETVPTFVGAQIIDDVRARAVVVQGGSGTINIEAPTNLAKITADATVYQHTEATNDITEGAPTIVPVSLNPKTLACAIPLSMEVVADSPNLDAVLRTSISSAFALKIDTLSIATLLADTAIPKSAVAHDPVAWAGVLLAVGAALAANQGLPLAHIGNTADFIARVSQLASTAGSWLGKPPALANMLELFTTSIAAGFAFLGDFAQGFAIAVRQDLRTEIVRFQKPTYASHLLMCTMRADGVVLQPKRLFKELKTMA